MSWGQELWDSYDKVSDHVSLGSSNLANVYAKFFKEKAEVEKEYAKGLRRIVAKYQPKQSKADKVVLDTGFFGTELHEDGNQFNHKLLILH